jgi:hypothetical protein
MISPYIYSGTRPFGKTYTNISSTYIVLSLFESNVNNYCGFSTSFSYISTPATSITVSFEPKQNSSFVLFGFTVIIIIEPFNQFFLCHEFNINLNHV